MVSHTEEEYLVRQENIRERRGSLWLRKGRCWDEQLCGNATGEEKKGGRDGGRLRACKRQRE